MIVVNCPLSVVRGSLNVRHQRTTDHGPPAPHRGISLTEVLIAMGILTLGLLGVAAIFPVGSWYIQKATIADNGSAIAQAVMSDIITRGTVDPKAWYSYVPVPLNTNTAPSNDLFPSDGVYRRSPGPSQRSFTRPVADTLREAIYQAAALNDVSRIDKQFGNAYVIDPLYIAAAAQWDPAVNNDVAYAFPASAIRATPRTGWAYYNAPEWTPWRAQGTFERMWPIRRVTLQDHWARTANQGWPMSPDMASHYFRGNDDLTTDFPSRADRPARQNWEIARSGSVVTPLIRQRTGDYSWIVCVVPTTRAARDGLASSPESYSYDVSVVVFYKRILPTNFASVEGINAAAAYERAVSAKILSTGLNGGELRLSTLVNGSGQPVDGITEDPFKNLRTGEWIMVCGPHPNSTISEPRFVMKWYQVLAIDKEGLTKFERNVTVRGPEWPWKPAADPGYSDGKLSNDLCAAIFRGAVAVHTKTIRLEGQYGDGMALVKP